MKWLFPAKTFLVGEYVALQGGPALILTTKPCFEVSMNAGLASTEFPVNSPAYNLWQEDLSSLNYILHWHDPYCGLGGMGASSAQFLGAYYAKSFINNKPIVHEEILSVYLKHAWNGKGVAPSGYDVIAQSMGGCVYIDGNTKIYQNYTWPFLTLGFILVHTGKKQATHTYLQNINELNGLNTLLDISKISCDAFIKGNSLDFIKSINDFYLVLCELNLVAKHTLEIVKALRENPDILAIKGCGALGADIILLIVESQKLADKVIELKQSGYNVITTSG